MAKVKQVNIAFLVTVLFSEIAPLLLYRISDNMMVRLIISQTILILPAAAYMLSCGNGLKETLRLKRVRPANVILLVVLTFLVLPIMTLVNAISMLYSVNQATSAINSISEEVPFLLSVLTIAVIPAIFEESVYRGVFFNEYRKVKPLAGVVLSGFLFGILHGNLNQFTYAFVLGMIFALVIEATDSIVASMIMHFTINLNSLVLMKIYPVLLDYLEKIYNEAIKNGDSQLAQSIVGVNGADSFDIGEIFDSMAGKTLGMDAFIQTAAIYAVPAVICTVFACIVYRAIAKNSGRWEHVMAMFGRKSPEGLGNDGYQTAGREMAGITAGEGKASLITLPLAAAIVYCFASMILNELVSRGIITL